MARIEDHTSHSIPLSQSRLQSKALTLFISVKAPRAEEAAEGKDEASRGQFMRLKEKRCLRNTRAHSEAAGADVDTASRRSSSDRQ